MGMISSAFKHLTIFILWIILVGLLTILLPLVLFVILVRGAEALVYYCSYGATPIRSVDVLWTFQTPQNRMNISGAMQLDGSVDLETFRSIVNQRLIEKRDDNTGKLVYPQATQYLMPGYINYYWANVEKYDINDHVYYLQKEPIESEDKLMERISKHVNQDFGGYGVKNDKSEKLGQSPWEIVLVPYKVPNNGREKTLAVFRLKHAIADGSALAYFLINQLADTSNQTGTMVKKFTQRQRVLLNLKAVWYLPMVYAKIMLHPAEQNVMYKTDLSGIKKHAWSKPIDLELVKKVKNQMGATVNDILVGCLSKSVGNYLSSKSADEEDHTSPEEINLNQQQRQQHITSIFAVDTRSSISEARYFRNQVAGIVFQLPTNMSEVNGSIQQTKKQFDKVKDIGEPISTNLGWHFLSFVLPARIAKFFVFDQIRKTTISISNLMGPQYPVYINGHQLDFVTFWPPGTYTQTASFSFCSYNEQIRLGVEIDTACMENPLPLIHAFEDIVDSL